jgi:hypothetical protein
MEKQKLWSIISFQFWNEEWVGSLGASRQLPAKLKAQFLTLENYFNAQAITLQFIANSRVNGFLDMINLEGLPGAVQECLRRYIYYAIDFLLYNGTVAEEQAVAYQSSSTSGRTDISTGMDALSSFDFLSTKAIDAWRLSGIESRWKLWLQEHGNDIDYPLLDIKKFYTKQEIDLIVAQLNMQIQLIDERVTKEVEDIDRHIQSNFNHLNKVKVDYSNATKLSDSTTGEKKLIRNLTFAGNLERTTFSETGIVVEDGTVLYDAEVYTSTDVSELTAIVVDNIDSSIADNPATQAPSFRLHKELKERVDIHGNELQHAGDFIDDQKFWFPGEIRRMPLNIEIEDKNWKVLGNREWVYTYPEGMEIKQMNEEGTVTTLSKKDFVIKSVCYEHGNKDFVFIVEGDTNLYKLNGYISIAKFPDDFVPISITQANDGINYICSNGTESRISNDVDNTFSDHVIVGQSFNKDDYIYMFLLDHDDSLGDLYGYKYLSNDEICEFNDWIHKLQSKMIYMQVRWGPTKETVYLMASDITGGIYVATSDSWNKVVDDNDENSSTLGDVGIKTNYITEKIGDLNVVLWQYDPNNEFDETGNKKTDTVDSYSKKDIRFLQNEVSNTNRLDSKKLIDKIIDFQTAKDAIEQLTKHIEKNKELKIEQKLSESISKKIALLEQFKNYMLSTPYGEENFKTWLIATGQEEIWNGNK